MTPRHRLAVYLGHQDVRRLQVAMDDRLLVGVLDALANQNEQLQTLTNGELFLVAVFGDGPAHDILHDEVRPALRCFARIKDVRDRGMIHQGQRLALGVEAGHHFPRVHTSLD
jgi:hypothetical protein